MTWIYILCIIFAYFIGSIPTAYLVGKSFAGIDIRRKGSGNVGMTNTLRSVGKKGALVVFVGDSLKGFIPSLLGLHLSGPVLGFVLGIVAIIGHIYPVWLKFHGGKGVATTFGVLLAVVPASAIIGLSTCVLFAALTGYVSLGSILAAISIPITLLVIYDNVTLFFISLPLVGLVIYLHRKNIQRIISHEEHSLYTKRNRTEEKS